MTLRFVYDFSATKAALLYLMGKGLNRFDKYKAAKLLFLADREHLLRFGRTISGDSYDALPYGPVPSETLALLDGIEAVKTEGAASDDLQVIELANSIESTEGRYPEYRALVDVDLDALSESDIKVLDHVALEHGNKSFQELFDLTHAMGAYKNAWRDESTHKRFPMRFEDFFADNPEKADFLSELLEDQFLETAYMKAAHTGRAAI
jgi:uncharacterized phage-associated protein